MNYLPKLDEKNKEDFTAFHNILAILEGSSLFVVTSPFTFLLSETNPSHATLA